MLPLELHLLMSTHAPQNLPLQQRIVLTGIGLTAPNGNDLAEYRAALLAGKSGVSKYEIRYVGETLAGICTFDALRHQSKKDLRRGTRAGSVGIYCTNEAVKDARQIKRQVIKCGTGSSRNHWPRLTGSHYACQRVPTFWSGGAQLIDRPK